MRHIRERIKGAEMGH